MAQCLSIKEDKLTNPDFLASSAYTRLEFWRNFRRKYPEVDISDQITTTLKERSQEMEQQADEQRVAQLEARVQQAEYRARRAERRSYSGYGSFYNFARPNFGYRFPATGHFGFSRYPVPHHSHRARSSATYHRVTKLMTATIPCNPVRSSFLQDFTTGTIFSESPCRLRIAFPPFSLPV